jgi:hypothetical protein
MYTLARQLSLRSLLAIQAPALIGALVIAEMFYKFHSFTLECLAFLATWGALDWMVNAFFIGRKPSKDSR